MNKRVLIGSARDRREKYIPQTYMRGSEKQVPHPLKKRGFGMTRVGWVE